ncbi:capsular polysaccharide transport system permease protein [Aliiruegeria haliotis]|uniref:Capsular polysaccharide transport system permease protein n=1 Tax=Aliiruegeria haliotis TaxID=1280846 RepID=A0A2T0RWR8_9RHOB|nr:capsule biosynthesis protein [Aliiruegeria haliotis]PRY25597.1 capsular polysaccharide transport system permease protein [Aliiruegeria haliotis]
MTTKAKAKNYRLKRDDALAEGVAPASVRPKLSAVAEAAAPPSPPQPSAEDTPTQSQTAHIGEVSTPQDVASETDIATIRREGLTGRQLRLARRTAQKHGLAPTSDFDAVRLLRAKGIDPFQRSNMLELVPGSGEAAPKTQPVQLPQTIVRSRPPSLPEIPLQIPEDRAGEILQIQQDIARRRRRKMLLLLARLSIFVFLPTLIAGWYFAVIATPMYATKSEFVIQQADSSAAASGIGGLFQGTGLAVQQDSTTVQSYLQSRDAMMRLDQDMGFKAHFSQDRIDPIQRLEHDASNEDAYKIYSKKVQVGFDPTEGILKMEVVAADPQTSQGFSEALIGYAEELVDNLTRRLREDQMAGAQESYLSAEQKVRDAQQDVLALQEELGVLDPVSETGALMQQITTFEVQLYEKKLQLEQLQANARPNQARVRGVQGDIARLEALIDDLRGSMTANNTGEASLARVSGQLRIAEAELTTRQLLLQQAATQLELARIEANRQVRYMAMGVKPVAPDEPTYPRAFENTLLAFAIFAGIFLMVSLTASVLREQISA